MTLHPLRRVRPLLLAALVAAPIGRLQAQRAQFSSGEKPFATISRILLNRAGEDSLVELARDQVGLDYRYGAKSPGVAFDCSGLVQWLMAKFNVDLPRTSRQQVHLGIPIPRDPDALLPGDLLFFGKGKRITHVGIYVGDGHYVQAANRRKGVVESPLPTGRRATTWWKGVRRLFRHDTATAISGDPGLTADSTG